MTRSPINTIALIATLAGSATLAGCVAPSVRDSAYNDRYGPHSSYGSYSSSYRACGNCGTVIDIARFHDERRASGGGAVLGAVVGGLAGNQVGSGSGRRAATVAGAVAGGVAGHRIEQHSGFDSAYEVHVRLDSGRVLVLEQRDIGRLRVGSLVHIVDGYAVLR